MTMLKTTNEIDILVSNHVLSYIVKSVLVSTYRTINRVPKTRSTLLNSYK